MPSSLLLKRRYEWLLQYETVRRWANGLKDGTGRRTALYHLGRYIEFLKQNGTDKTPDQLINECFNGTNRTTAMHLDWIKKFVEGPSLGLLGRAGRDRIYTSLRSFYTHNRVTLPREPLRYKDGNNVSYQEDGNNTLDQIRKAVNHRGCSTRDRAIILCMAQSAMDDSTLAEVFNNVGYPQLVKLFGSRDHNSWTLDTCPVRIELVRPKTGYRYYSFLDRDAISALVDWLNVRRTQVGKNIVIHAMERPNKLPESDPIFIVKRGIPLRPYLISKIFKDVGMSAGINVRPSAKVAKFKGASIRYPFHSHECRDLLKSLARVSGVSDPVSEFILGHKPDRFGYDKSPWKSPDFFRDEYKKMSSVLNVLSGTSSSNPAIDNEEIDEMRKVLETQGTLIDTLYEIKKQKEEMTGLMERRIKQLEEYYYHDNLRPGEKPKPSGPGIGLAKS